jgi:hypothetical protein
VCLRTSTEVKEKIDQGSEVWNSLDWFGGRWEATLHVRKGGFCQSGHAGRKGKILLLVLIKFDILENCRENLIGKNLLINVL